MSDKVIIFDTTLRDGEQCPGASMNLREKMEVARQLARLNVDVIEAGFPVISDGDFEAVQRIATEVKGPIIAGLARCVTKDIEAAGAAVQPAGERGRIHVFLADTTSSTNMSVGATSGFGLWANTGGVATATRDMNVPLGAGDNFTIRLDNNYVDAGSQVGFSLADSAGTLRFRFYFVGGQANYFVSDTTTGRATSIPWTDAGLTISFTQSSATGYSVTVGASTITGTLAAGNAISRVVIENNNAGSNADYNLYFGEMSITDAL